MPDIDLDAARAARLEAQDDRGFVLQGERFILPAELPYDAVLAAGDLVSAQDNPRALEAFLSALLGPEDYARFKELRPSMPDLDALVGELFGAYGLAQTGPGANGDGGVSDAGKSRPSSAR